MASSTSTSTLVFVDLPPKTFVGIDLVSFNSASSFHGITKIPSGLHFIYTGTDASLSIRHGRWMNVPSNPDSSIQALKWISEDESLTVVLHSPSDTRLPSRGLIDYAALCDASSKQAEKDALPNDFPALTSHITNPLLTRILPPQWTISSTSSSPRDTEADSIPGLTHLEASSAFAPDSALNVLDINPKQTWADGDIGADRTEKARDRSWYLGHLMDQLSTRATPAKDRKSGAGEILGELQFCFFMVLTLSNYSCLEQWKRILGVVLTCKKALGEIEGYFVEVLRVLEMQLRHTDDVEGGLFELRDEIASGWLRGLVGVFGESVREVVGQGELNTELERFEGEMRERFGWERKGEVLRRGMLELEDGERIEVSLEGADEDEDRGEYAPVVVET